MTKRFIKIFVALELNGCKIFSKLTTWNSSMAKEGFHDDGRHLDQLTFSINPVQYIALY